MSILSQLTMTRKVQIGLIVLIAMLIVTSGFSYIRITDIDSNISEIQNNYMVQLQANMPIRDAFAAAQVAIRDFQLDLTEMDAARAGIEELVNYAEAQLDTAADPVVMASLEDLIAQAGRYLEQMEVVRMASSEEESHAAIEALGPIGDAVERQTEQARELVMARLGERLEQADQSAGRARSVALVLAFAGVITAGGCAVYLTKDLGASVRRIQHAVSEAVTQAEEAASGAQQVAASSEQSKASMEECDQAVEEISSAVTQSSSAVEEISASITNVSTSVQQLADDAGGILESSRTIFEELRQVDGEVKSGKNVLNSSSEQLRHLESEIANVSSISDTIMEITDQTNLLALNAAIEAARAGEHGRGFSVVADEVRKLAEESREATEKIQGILASIEEASQAVLALMLSGGTGDKRSIVDVFAVIDEASTGVSESMEAAVSQAESQADAAAAASGSAQEISAAAEELAAQLQQSSSGAEQMSSNTHEVLSAVNAISSAVEQIAAAAQQQSAMIKRIEQENATLA